MPQARLAPLVTLAALLPLAACGSSGSSGASPTADGGTFPDGGALADGGTLPDTDAGSEPLLTSFVFVGCNRVMPNDWQTIKADDPSSANVPQLVQTFADIVALPDTPKHFFFTGDLVLGLWDVPLLKSELAAWATLFKADPIAQKVPLVPMVGNHEVLTDKGATVETPLAGADGAWTEWIAANGWDAHAGNGPTSAPPNADALGDDQSKMSYSYDDGDTHFVVLNTDSLAASNEIGWIPLQWLTADLKAAQDNASVSRIFVFGHKPIVAPSGSTSPAEAVTPSLATGIASLLDATPKVKGYFCAHSHRWDARKLPGSRGVYQIVAGNGGSLLETSFKQPYYGFTEARIYASGRVGIVSHQRPVPSPYYAAPAAPATAAPELTIAP